MGCSSRSRRGFVCAVALLIILSAAFSVWGQRISQSPYSASSAVRGGRDLSPSNPLAMPGSTGGLPGGSDSIYLTDQMFRDILGPIPNLQVRYLYSFGKAVETSRLTLDYLLPVRFGNSAVFGEAHSEFQDFWKTIVSGGANHRVDLWLGGGFRTMPNDNIMLGVNGFFDSTRLGGRWYSSGSIGFEMAALLPGNDALDLSFNWYGDPFRSNELANTFRRGPQNFDFQAGYSHELWDGGPDFRLSATGYKFSTGRSAYGRRAGAELMTRDGMFSVKYEIANDRLNDTYHTVSATVNVGLDLGAVLNGESPFVMPEPIFKSPRVLARYLGFPVRRLGSRGIPTKSVCIYGPIEILHMGKFLQGQVPDLTGARGVHVNWHGITPDWTRQEVWFSVRDGERILLTYPYLDMSQASGSVVVNFFLDIVFPTSLNEIIYVEDNTGAPLVIESGGDVCFIFFW